MRSEKRLTQKNEREGIKMTKLFIIFVVCNIINVVIQTVKSIATIKCGKIGASVINALAYGFYTYIVVLMVCELPLLAKCLIVGGCNLVGVYIVKLLEEKIQKEKLWRVEATVNRRDAIDVAKELNGIPFTKLPINEKHCLMLIYCETKAQSKNAKEVLNKYQAKYFVSENKGL